MLAAGDHAPDFILLDETSSPRSLAGLLRHGSLILYFYPADFTPGCTHEACLFRDAYTALSAAGLTIAGVSPDTAESHARFKDRYSIPYPLLADPELEAVRAYGVGGPFGIGVRRATFLIDEGAVVVDALLADLRISRHETFIHDALARAGRS